MTKNVTFQDNPALDMGRYQVPGYSRHFPTENAYQEMSEGKATQQAFANGGYFGHDIAHSVVENNREDPELVRRKRAKLSNAEDYFILHDHMHGGKPKYRDEMIPGYTGFIPCREDDMGKSYHHGGLEGTLEFERVKVGIPRFRFPLDQPLAMQPTGGRKMCVKGNIDRDEVPIDDTTPLFVPRYMCHNHDSIMHTFQTPALPSREHC